MKMAASTTLSVYTLLSCIAFLSADDKKQDGHMFRKLLQKSITAPSWQFKGIDHAWKNDGKYNDKGIEALSIFVQDFERSYQAAKRELILMFGEDSMIESRLRPLKSISDELDNDSNKTVKDLYDVITWRVTLPTVDQVVQAEQRFINSSRFGVAIVKCFGVCPRAGKYAASGYRGITLVAEIDGKPLEVQLVTPYMTMWADWAYGVLLDESLGKDEDVQKYSHQLSDYYYYLDVLRDKRPVCPNVLRQTNMKKLSSKMTRRNKIFEALGAPPSACQFWNDLSVNKHLNAAARRQVLNTITTHKWRNRGNQPSVIDIDKILTPESLKEENDKDKETKGSKRTLTWPVYLYY